ncbi:MAG: DUF4178 domain-containing protein [Pseudomonadota bacterium]
MTAAAELRSLTCDACGAGQSLRGGGRIAAHLCLYCGATLEAAEAFRAMRPRKGDGPPDRERQARDWPKTPFEIGQTGEIGGVEVTIIGVIGRKMAYDGKVWRWTEHQLYSPTHGYAWLSWEENRIVFTRKSRVPPKPFRIGYIDIGKSESRPSAFHLGRRYSYYDSGWSEIEFAAGSFNFIPTRGDRSHAANLLGARRMLTYRIYDDRPEVEWELSEALDRDAVFKSFGLDPATAPPKRGVHPLEPFERSPALADLRNMAIGFAIVALVAAVIAPRIDLQRIAAADWRPNAEGASITMTVTDADRLVELEIETDVSNAWVEVELEVEDQAGEPVFAVERVIEYYYGYDDGNWTEGSRVDSVYFRVPEPGVYTAFATVGESGVWRGSFTPERLRLSAREGVGSPWPLVIAAALFALTGFGLIGQRILHVTRRWSGSDWSDD